MRSFILVLGLVMLTGCASYLDYGHDRYGVIRDAQEPTAIGVSNSYAVLYNCKGTQVEGYFYQKLEFSDCNPVTGLQHASAPGWFPNVFQGMMNLAGFGWVASAQGGNGSSSSSSASSTSSSSASGGSSGHGGHH